MSAVNAVLLKNRVTSERKEQHKGDWHGIPVAMHSKIEPRKLLGAGSWQQFPRQAEIEE